MVVVASALGSSMLLCERCCCWWRGWKLFVGSEMWWGICWCTLLRMGGRTTTKVMKMSFTCSLFVKLTIDDRSPPTAKDDGGCMMPSSLYREPSDDLDIAPPTENGCSSSIALAAFKFKGDCID